MKNILIVDDDSVVRNITKQIIVEIGYDPIVCENGEQAIPHIDKADLLLTDFNMSPGMNGAELTEIAKSIKPGLPVIIMTGTPLDIPSDHLADKVIRKPFTSEQLEKVVADFLRK